MSVNKAILLGFLGKDPELKYTTSGTAVCNFSVATSESWKDADGAKQESTTWHNIVAWGKQGEVIKEYFTKGQQIYLEGGIVNRSYEDKDGNKKYISEIKLQNFSFVGSKSDNEGGQESTPDKKPVTTGDDPALPF